MRRPPTFLAAAGGLYAAWLAATYLLEGLPRTLLRPDAVALRAAYAVVANVLVGIGGGGLALTWLVRRVALPPAAAGVQRSARTVVSVVSGTALGIATYALQSPPARAAAVTVNAFLQVFTVSPPRSWCVARHGRRRADRDRLGAPDGCARRLNAQLSRSARRTACHHRHFAGMPCMRRPCFIITSPIAFIISPRISSMAARSLGPVAPAPVAGMAIMSPIMLPHISIMGMPIGMALPPFTPGVVAAEPG
jgi:hypothetical protein